MNQIDSIITQLEQQKDAIDRALSALREVEGSAVSHGPAPGNSAPTNSHGKRKLSPEGRRRIIEATRRYWAEKRRGGATKAGTATTVQRKDSKPAMSAAVKHKLSLAAKRRWARLKRQHPNANRLG